MTNEPNYDPNVLESTDAMLPDANQRRVRVHTPCVNALRQWYRFTARQLNNMNHDPYFQDFWEKYFLAGAEKIKSNCYVDIYGHFMKDYEHILRRNKRTLLARNRRRILLNLLILAAAFHYAPSTGIFLPLKSIRFVGNVIV